MTTVAEAPLCFPLPSCIAFMAGLAFAFMAGLAFAFMAGLAVEAAGFFIRSSSSSMPKAQNHARTRMDCAST